MIPALPATFDTEILNWFRIPLVLAGTALVLAVFLSLRMFPVIIYLCQHKNLMDEPGTRKVHREQVPNLGGVGLFVAFVISLTALGCMAGLPGAGMSRLLALTCGVTILFFLGIKDDLIGLSPKKKFVGQVAAALVIILLTDLRITSLEGLLGMDILPYWVSVGFTLFVFLLVVNAYNLIDGIDGLAGVFAISTSLCFGTFFLLNGDALAILVAFILTGAVLGFLKFNFSHTQKVFMGDSGTLFIGFVLAFEAIAFLGLNQGAGNAYRLPNGPIMVLAALSFPLLDTLRVFLLRLLEGRSPFSADRNHIHHRLLNLGLSHGRATALIVFLNTVSIAVALYMADWEINIQLALICLLVPLLFALPFLLHRAGSNWLQAGEPPAFAVESAAITRETRYRVAERVVRSAAPGRISSDAYERGEKEVRVLEKKIEPLTDENSRLQRLIKNRLEDFKKFRATSKI